MSRTTGISGALLVATAIYAQQAGQIVGVATDSSGAVVVGVTVTATEVGTGSSRSAMTGNEGQYVLPSLLPTRYELTAGAPGFRTFRTTDFELLANQSLTINVVLELGPVTETVTVSGAVVQVDTSTSSLSEVVDRARIVELPLNGRDASQLATLVAGAVLVSVSPEQSKSIPGAPRISTNGSGNGQISYRLDGVTNTDTWYQDTQSFPFPDALQEFSIQTSNYSAAQGNNAGAMVNVVTRSGTNELHGGVFGFIRNRVFNARNTFASEADFLKRGQWGALIGGPVVLPGYNGRNRTFFFLGWQGTSIRNRDQSPTSFAPTIDQRQGNFSTCGNLCNQAIRDPLTNRPFPGNQIPVTRFDPSSVKVLDYIPAVGGDGRVIFGRNISDALDQGVAKIDHMLNSNDRLSFRYFTDTFRHAPVYNDNNLLTWQAGSSIGSFVRTQNAVLAWTKTWSSTVLNDFHFGVNRTYSDRQPPAGFPGSQQLGIRLPLYSTIPTIHAIGVTGHFIIQDNPAARFIRNSFEWSNRTSWVKGRHSLQFGGEIGRYRADVDNEFQRPGRYIFSGDITGMAMADFFLGRLRTFQHGTGEYVDARNTYGSLFFQDAWRATSRLTLNMGIRYEPAMPWHEVVGRWQKFRIADYQNGVRSQRFANAPPGVFFRDDPGVPHDGMSGDFNNVGARTGFAWDVLGNGKTSIRGGAGMFYNQHMRSDTNLPAVRQSPWGLEISRTNPTGPFSDPYRGNESDFAKMDPNLGKGHPDAPFFTPVSISTFDDRLRTPLLYNWNLTIEREVLPQWLARVGYVGSATNYGLITKQLNPAQTLLGSTLGVDARRLFAPHFGSINHLTFDRRSYYHSLQTSLVKRFSRGFTIQANYTFSKALGNSAAGSSAAVTANEVAPWYFPDADKLTYGPLDSDRRHRFVTSYVWDLPNLPTSNPIVTKVLHGWQWTGIGQYQTGGPLIITSGRDNSRTAIGRDRAQLTGVSMEAPAGADPTVWFNSAAFAQNPIGTFGNAGIGQIYGPGLHSWDMGMFKSTRLNERWNMQFRAEFFNIFNQVNYANPRTNVGGVGLGTIISAADPRIVQFALKFLF